MQMPSQVINAEDEKYNSVPFSMYSILWGDLEKWEIIKLRRKLQKRNLYPDNLSSKCKHGLYYFRKRFPFEYSILIAVGKASETH